MPAYNETSIEVIELPKLAGIPANMPLAIDITSLAHSLRIRARTLTYLVTSRKHQYTAFQIPKKKGGHRTIHAPKDMLKFVQGRVLSNILDNYKYPDHIGAYVPSRSTRYSAEKHAGKATLIVVDLKDFFPSTRGAWVRRAVMDLLGYSHHVSGLIADLATIPLTYPWGTRSVVPQGAPTSGAVCNLVAMLRIDEPILEMCKELNLTYTRYADDLAFSSDIKLDSSQVRYFLRRLNKIVKDGGYRINWKKVRVARRGKHQRLLGMTVNEKPNVMRTHYRKLRARLHHCLHKGFAEVAKEMGIESGAKLESSIEGQISYYHMINPDKAAKLQGQLDAVRKAHA